MCINQCVEHLGAPPAPSISAFPSLLRSHVACTAYDGEVQLSSIFELQIIVHRRVCSLQAEARHERQTGATWYHMPSTT